MSAYYMKIVVVLFHFWFCTHLKTFELSTSSRIESFFPEEIAFNEKIYFFSAI